MTLVRSQRGQRHAGLQMLRVFAGGFCTPHKLNECKRKHGAKLQSVKTDASGAKTTEGLISYVASKYLFVCNLV